MLTEHQLPHCSCQMKGSVIWLSLQRKAQTDKKAACMKILLVRTKKCRKNLRVSHDTTLSIYDDIVQNRCILPLLMILTKLLIKSIMWPFINDGLKLLLLSNIITIAGHAWAILSSQTFNTSLDLVVTITQEAWQFSDRFLECLMDSMDFNWWNSSVSFLYGTMKTIYESGHAWAIAQ